MAVNLSKKKQNLAVRSLELAKFVVDINGRIDKNSKTHTNNGITYTAGDFDDLESLQHVDPADMATLLSGLAALNAWLNEAGQFRMDIFYKVLDGS